MTKKPKPLEYSKPVLIVGPADINFESLAKLARHGFAIVAADGGANRLMNKGVIPDAIIGDMDSLDMALAQKYKIRMIKTSEQDSTDFEKCLYSIDAPLFLALGFTGKRFDHTMATLHGMVKYHPEKKIILVGGEDVSFIHSGKYEKPATKGQVFSIFPLEQIEFSNGSGLKYSLQNLELSLGKAIGTSNLATEEIVTVIPAPQYAKTPYLVTLPNAMLDGLIHENLTDG